MTAVWALDSVPVAMGTWGLPLLLESICPSLQDRDKCPIPRRRDQSVTPLLLGV